jgi:hypothetical protein
MSFGIYTNVVLIHNAASGGVSVGSNALIKVVREDTGVDADIFEDRAGGTPLANPFSADGSGRFEFYAAGIDEGYKITATKGADQYTLRNQPVGTLQERDITDADQLGDQVVAFHYSGVAIDEEIIVDGFLFDAAATITKVDLYAREAPAGADLTIDFLKDQVEQTNIATLADGALKQSTAIAGLTYTTSEEMGLKIKSVGSTDEGAELEIIVHYHVDALT